MPYGIQLVTVWVMVRFRAFVAQITNLPAMPWTIGWTLVILAAVTIAGALVGYRYLRGLRKRGPAVTWPSFMLGPGAMQVGSLSAGMLFAGFFAAIAPGPEFRSEEAGVFRLDFDLSRQPVFTREYFLVRRYRYVTVVARVVAPAGGKAAVVVYGVDNTGTAGMVRRMSASAGEWTMWQGPNSSERLRVVAERSDDTAGPHATRLDVILLLHDNPSTPVVPRPAPPTVDAAPPAE